MVTRHEVPGKCRQGARPEGRYERFIGCGMRMNETSPKNVCEVTTPGHTVPYGTDHVCLFPRHFMPGYLHLVGTPFLGAVSGSSRHLQLKEGFGPREE